MSRISTAAVLDRLTIKHSRFVFDGDYIGSMVSYGAPNAPRIGGNVSSRTEYASRIYGDGLTIEETASNPGTLLKRVAGKLAKAINEGKFQVAQKTDDKPAPTEGQSI